jgi:hypothetical protein
MEVVATRVPPALPLRLSRLLLRPLLPLLPLPLPLSLLEPTAASAAATAAAAAAFPAAARTCQQDPHR